MRQLRKIAMIFAVGGALAALGAAGGWWWAKHQAAPVAMAMTQAPATAAAMQDEGKVLYWYDPMYPQQHFDKPGKSPFMDMQLVARQTDASGGAAGVKIDPAITHNLGVRLATVTRIPLTTQIEVSGMVGFNERDVAVVQTRSAGFVERVWPLAPNDVVKQGQPLVELLVPEWAAAQHELLAIRASDDAALLTAARERLHLLGMPQHMIDAVEESGVVQARYTITSPISGVVQTLEVRNGMSLAMGQTLARINGLGTVWLEVAVPQDQADAVRIGSVAQVHLEGFDAQTINGRVSAILPMLNDATRSLRLRVELPNRAGRVHPGMSAQVSLKSETRATALAVPTEAIIRTGKRTLLMLADEPGRFIPVEVTAGREIGDMTVIMSGLNEGQQVVTSGQFLIDSEAKLSGIAVRNEMGGGQ